VWVATCVIFDLSEPLPTPQCAVCRHPFDSLGSPCGPLPHGMVLPANALLPSGCNDQPLGTEAATSIEPSATRDVGGSLAAVARLDR
ncbi:unnamed protein product, partial [Symbiodinium microadriaticum]